MLELDRIAVEEAGADPARLAAAVLRQLPEMNGPVPVHDIARALDIEEIREAPLTSFEGCLITDQHKSVGAILVNATSSPRRGRYTIAHELGHFLNERHRPTAEDGFRCSGDDLSHPLRSGIHLKQEREANQFAIELLAPSRLMRARLARPADLEHALAIADALEISREAAVRRYVALHGECLAVVFSRHGRVRYVEKGDGFPATTIWTNDPIPMLPAPPRDGSDLTSLDEASADLWLSRRGGAALFAQTLHQAEGYATTLLVVERDDEE